MDYILAPSILSADFKVLGEQMKLTEDNGAKYLHFDVMEECSCQAFPLACQSSRASVPVRTRSLTFT